MNANSKKFKKKENNISPVLENELQKRYSNHHPQGRNTVCNIERDQQLYHCPNCENTYVSISRYMRHLRCHLGYYPYECSDCSLCFNSKNLLKSHKREHDDHRKYRCAFCAESFNHRFGLSRHLLAHSAEACIDCFICGAEFPSLQARSRHVKNHVVSCGLCNVEFLSNGELQDHILATHRSKRAGEVKSVFDLYKEETSFKERVDSSGMSESKVFTESSHAANESRTAQKQKRKSGFKCFICLKLLPYRSSFTKHLKAHKCFNCCHCPSFFASAADHEAHERTCPKNPRRVADSSEMVQVSEVRHVEKTVTVTSNLFSDSEDVPSSDMSPALADPKGDEAYGIVKRCSLSQISKCFSFTDDVCWEQLDLCDVPYLDFNNNLHSLWLTGFIERLKTMELPIEAGIFKKMTYIQKFLLDSLVLLTDERKFSFLYNSYRDLSKIISDQIESVNN